MFDRHINPDQTGKGVSQFKKGFNLTVTLALLTEKSWTDDPLYRILEEGYKYGHGHYLMYVFRMEETIGTY